MFHPFLPLPAYRRTINLKKAFYVTITDSFQSNMFLFIVLTKSICPYEKHGKNSYSLGAESSVQQCAIPCMIEQCFPTFVSWRDPCLCKRFTYGGGKKCNAWTVLHYCQMPDKCPVTTGGGYMEFCVVF